MTSADGTPIAVERHGSGPPVVLVGGALCDRAAHRQLAEQLAGSFTAVTYDRRGRGDSGVTTPYSVEREAEDLRAVVEALGGRASVYGHSSGAGLVLRAAAHGVPVDRVVLHEPPYNPDDEEARLATRDYVVDLDRLLAERRHDEAVQLFLTTVGLPPDTVEQLRSEPSWPGMVAMAPTLAYESEVMGDRSGGTIPVDEAGRVGVPALVLTGGASPAWMIDIGRQVAAAMPRGRHEVLEGQEHVVAPEILAPVLAGFLST
ncbi:MAG TPA: alpha/beta hydrolase [Jiangellales bacterium]|nr:alpha/beta hydrolase [Jiangellales bacterium]